MKGSRILVAVCVLSLVLVSVAIAAKPGTQPESDTTLFYLTAQTYRGDGPLTPGVCAAGYHMASRWEFRDLSRLDYATSEPGAYIADDQGAGTPLEYGWIRSGYQSSGNAGYEGNCFNWTSADLTHDGGIMSIRSDTNGTRAVAVNSDCGTSRPVWCMQD